MKTHFTRENIAVTLIVFAGLILRLRQYLAGRSLWVDEAMLALNIVNRDFMGLFKPLDYDQGAPIGFLLAEKCFNLLLGRNEFSLRLFPLLVGLISLWMFYLLLKRFTNGLSLIVALALFAFNPRLIYYSSEVKQYIVDAAVTISLLLLAVWLFESSSRKGLWTLAVAGSLALWFSHPSLFALAGIGLTLFLLYLVKRDFSSLRLVTGAGIVWLANLGLLFSLTLGDLRSNVYMREYWQDAFAPLPPWSDWNWYWISFQKNMDTHFAIPHAAWIAFVLMLAGWINLFSQKRTLSFMLAGAFFFTLLASSLGLYPALERMTLFLIPIGLLLIAKALEFLEHKVHIYPTPSILVITAISVFLFYGAIPRTLEQFITPKYLEHIRPALEFLQGAWQDGDSMYVSNGAVPAFEYYAPIYGLENISYVSNHRNDYKNPDAILKQVAMLKGQQRVWVLLSHVYEKGNFNERNFLLEYLKENGSKKREFREPGTSVYLYLYDLSE